jgi:hypothetical protein
MAHRVEFCGVAVYPLDLSPKEACGRPLPCEEHPNPICGVRAALSHEECILSPYHSGNIHENRLGSCFTITLSHDLPHDFEPAKQCRRCGTTAHKSE